VRTRVESMHSIGPVTAKRLAEVGITNADSLRAAGAVTAFRMLRFRFGRAVTLNALYGLDAAVRDVHWREIDEERKAELRLEAGLD
jgi:DNA transformation protein and related proteins